MKPSKFNEAQIIEILREAEAGGEDRRSLPPARDQQFHILRLERQIRRHGGLRRQAAEGARGGERQAQEAACCLSARSGCVEGSPQPKVVTPAARREAVAILVEVHEMSEVGA